MNLRSRRMDTEWQLLEALADANPTVFAAITRSEMEFCITMRESPAWVGNINQRRIETDHEIRYVYPRYYPSLPLESYFVRPVLHVNVDPVTGFVCLWKEYRPKQTIVDAILITRAVMSWKSANLNPVHRMHPDADMDTTNFAPLPMPSLIVPANCLPILSHRNNRQRLSSEFPDHGIQEGNFALSDIE